MPWKDISPDLAAVSDIDIYTTFFTVPGIKDIGAYLLAGPIFNILRTWVNSELVSPFPADHTVVDISRHLHLNQTNTPKAEVLITLYNRLRAEMNTTSLWDIHSQCCH